jgi:hypothetical protein
MGIDPKEMKSLSWRNICIPRLIAALFTIIKIHKQPSGHQQMIQHRKHKYFSAIKMRKSCCFQKHQ